MKTGKDAKLIEIALLFLAFFLPGFIWQNTDPMAGGPELSAYMSQFLVVAIPQTLLIVYVLYLRREHLERFGLVRPRAIDLPHSLLIYLGIFLLLAGLSLLLSLLPTEKQEIFKAGFRWKLRNPRLIPLVLLFCLVTGYREELFFRAYLITRLSQLGSPPLLTLLTTSLIFSLGHLYQGASGLAVAFIQGFYFGMIFLRLGNLHRIAWAHALYNSTILLATLFTDFPLPE